MFQHERVGKGSRGSHLDIFNLSKTLLGTILIVKAGKDSICEFTGNVNNYIVIEIGHVTYS